MSEHEPYDEARVKTVRDVVETTRLAIADEDPYNAKGAHIVCRVLLRELGWLCGELDSEHSLRLEAEARVRELEKIAARARVVIEANDAAVRGEGRPWAGEDAREALRSALAALETGGEG